MIDRILSFFIYFSTFVANAALAAGVSVDEFVASALLMVALCTFFINAAHKAYTVWRSGKNE